MFVSLRRYDLITIFIIIIIISIIINMMMMINLGGLVSLRRKEDIGDIAAPSLPHLSS